MEEDEEFEGEEPIAPGRTLPVRLKIQRERAQLQRLNTNETLFRRNEIQGFIDRLKRLGGSFNDLGLAVMLYKVLETSLTDLQASARFIVIRLNGGLGYALFKQFRDIGNVFRAFPVGTEHRIVDIFSTENNSRAWISMAVPLSGPATRAAGALLLFIKTKLLEGQQMFRLVNNNVFFPKDMNQMSVRYAQLINLDIPGGIFMASLLDRNLTALTSIFLKRDGVRTVPSIINRLVDVEQLVPVALNLEFPGSTFVAPQPTIFGEDLDPLIVPADKNLQLRFNPIDQNSVIVSPNPALSTFGLIWEASIGQSFSVPELWNPRRGPDVAIPTIQLPPKKKRKRITFTLGKDFEIHFSEERS